MLRDKEKNRLFRRVSVRIVFPDNTLKTATVVQKAGPRQGFTSAAIEDILMQIADRLDTLYPWWDFKAVPLSSPGRVAYFVFSCVGSRPMQGADPTVRTAPEFTQDTTQKESNTSEPEIAETTPADAGDSSQLPPSRVAESFEEVSDAKSV